MINRKIAKKASILKPLKSKNKQAVKLQHVEDNVYAKQLQKLIKSFLDIALRGYATYEAAQRVNETLRQRLNLNDTDGFDLVYLESVLVNVTKAELIHAITSATTLPAASKRALASRLLQQIANQPEKAKTDSRQTRLMLENLVAREARYINQSPKTNVIVKTPGVKKRDVRISTKSD